MARDTINRLNELLDDHHVESLELTVALVKGANLPREKMPLGLEKKRSPPILVISSS